MLDPKRGELSDAVCAILNIQWEAVRNGLLEMVEASKAEQAQASMPVDNVEALVTASKLCAQSTVLSVDLDVAVDSTRSCRQLLGNPLVSFFELNKLESTEKYFMRNQEVGSWTFLTKDYIYMGDVNEHDYA